MASKPEVKIIPRSADKAINNEHLIIVPTNLDFDFWELDRMRERIFYELKMIFPDGANRGDRFEIYRAPQESELSRVQELAEKLGFTLNAEIRSENELKSELRDVGSGYR